MQYVLKFQKSIDVFTNLDAALNGKTFLLYGSGSRSSISIRLYLQRPIVVVIGATGQQGGGCLDALVKAGKFTPRAMTRDTESKASKALSSRNIEVVPGTLDDKETLQKVRNVMRFMLL